jgi:Site-specific recombinase XerD
MGIPTRKCKNEKQRIRKDKTEYVNPDNAEALIEFCDTFYEENIVKTPPEGESSVSASTINSYVNRLRRLAKEIDLLDTDEVEIKRLLQALKDGSLPSVKDSGLTDGTLSLFITALGRFYSIYPEVGIDMSQMPDMTQSDTKVDPSDMLTRDEIQSLRNAATNSRNTAIFDFLLYTGQRLTVARTLEIRHLDLENSQFKLNEDAEGLKGADKHGTWRDLLLSEASIQQWLRTGHPEPDNPDAVLFCPLRGDDSERATRRIKSSTRIYRILKDMKEKVGLDKPLNPHALRHNFVTIALRRGVPESAIKHQLGHAPNSRIMRSTYSHLKDSDHIRQAREAFDLEVDDDESELTPGVCPRCGENPPEKARICPYCGLEYTPDAKEMIKQVYDTTREKYQKVETEEKLKAVQTGDEILDRVEEDPELKGKLVEKLKDEMTKELLEDLE